LKARPTWAAQYQSTNCEGRQCQAITFVVGSLEGLACRGAASGGWAFFNFNHGEPKFTSAAVKPREECAACHISGAKKDWVWTQFYRLLDR
jgi:hypothetical protein